MIRRVLEAIAEKEFSVKPEFVEGPVEWDWQALAAERQKWIKKAKLLYKHSDPATASQLINSWDDAMEPWKDYTDPVPLMNWFKANVSSEAFAGDYTLKPKGPNPNAGKWKVTVSDTNGDYIETLDGAFDTEEEANEAGMDAAQDYAGENAWASSAMGGEEETYEDIMANMAVYVDQIKPEDEW